MNVKVALFIAAGVVALASAVAFAPLQPPRSTARLERVETDVSTLNRRLNEFTAAIHDRMITDHDATAAAVTRLDRLDAAVRALEKRPTPTAAVERETAPPPRPFVPANSVAVLPFRHAPQPGEELPRAGYHPLAAALTTALVNQPQVRVRSLATLGEPKSVPSDPVAAGRALDTRYVVSVTSMRHYRSTRPHEYALHVELIEVGTGATVRAEDVKFGWHEETVEPGDPAGKALADLARRIAEKVAAE